MKRKLLLGLSLLLSASFAQAQWANNVAYTYSFGTDAATYVPTPAGNGTKVAESTTSVKTFLPQPTSGGVRIVVSVDATKSEPGGGIILNGDNTLSVKQPGVAGLTKFSAYNMNGATDVAKVELDVNFNTDLVANNYQLGIGNNKNTLFYSVSSIYRGSTEIFSALRWTFSAGNSVAFAYRKGSNASVTTYTDINSSTFVKGTTYKLEVYCNNSSSAANYMEGITPVTLPSNTFHIWVDGVQVGGDFDRSIEESNTSSGSPASPALGAGTSVAAANGAALNGVVFHSANNAAKGTAVISNLSLTYSIPPVALPVSLTSFSGKTANNAVVLNWQTASELNNSYFELLRSENGQDFKVVGNVKGNSTSQKLNNYTYSDNRPANGVNYYQLKQVDYNGEATVLGNTLAINYSINLADFKVVSSGNNLSVSVYVNKAGATDFSITNVQGIRVAQQTRNLTKGLNSFTIEANKLTPGVYVAGMRNEDGVKVFKFLKH